MHIYLGIDCSLNRTGLCAVDGDRKLLSAAAVVPPKALRTRDSRGARLRFIYNTVVTWRAQVAEHGEISRAVLEGGAFRANSRLYELGEAAGVVRLALEEAGVTVITAAPSAIKQAFTGHGNATKEEMQAQAYAMTGIRLGPDESDAYAMALYAHMWR